MIQLELIMEQSYNVCSQESPWSFCFFHKLSAYYSSSLIFFTPSNLQLKFRNLLSKEHIFISYPDTITRQALNEFLRSHKWLNQNVQPLDISQPILFFHLNLNLNYYHQQVNFLI